MKIGHIKRWISAVLAFSMLTPVSVTAAEETEEKSVIIDDAVTTVTDELFRIQYEPARHWTAESGHSDLFYDGTDFYSVSGENGTEDFYTMKFIGSGIEIYGSKNVNHSDCDVYIDDVKKGGMSAHLQSGSAQHQQMLFSAKGLSEGEHTLKVVKQEATETLAMQLDYIKVYYKSIPVQAIRLSRSEITLEQGSTGQITAEIVPWPAEADILWSSADSKVVTVDADGVITAVSSKPAHTTVTATVQGSNLQAEASVNVIPKVTTLSAFVGSTDRLETQEDYQTLRTQFASTWHDTAWRGDELLSKIVTVSREKVVHDVTVEATDFTDPSGNVISASNVEIKWLKDVMANIGRGNASAPVKPFPDVIHRGGAIDLEPETVRFAWICIHIPRNAKAGVYKGTVTVSAEELDTPYVFDYEFEVLDLLQPEEPQMEVQVWQHPFSAANYYGVPEEKWFTEEHFKYMRGSMEEYRSMGGRDVVANIVEEAWNHQSFYSDPSMVKWTKKKDGTFAFDYTWYDAWVRFQIECGVLDPENGTGQIKCYSIVPWNNQITYFDEASSTEVKQSYTPGADDWTEIWTAFLRDFMKHSRENGWFEITYISMDERGLTDLQAAAELIHSVKDENGESLKISSALNYAAPEYYNLTDLIDDISINLGSTDMDSMKTLSGHRAQLGLTTTLYTCTGNYPSNYTISDPADNMWLMWYSMALGTDGYMRWAWDNWVEDPLTDVTYQYWEPGDGWFIYPSEKGSEDNPEYFYSTPRYEMMKKGIRDVNKAKYLMARSNEMRSQISGLLKSIRRPGQKNSAYGSAGPANDEARELTIAEANRMREGVLALSREFKGDELRAALEDANKLDQNAYTEESWKKLAEAVKAAEMLDENTPQKEIGEAAALIRSAIENLELPYVDVNKNDWFYDAVRFVHEGKIVEGMDKIHFQPYVILARAQFSLMLYRMEGKPEFEITKTFPDVQDGVWFTDAILWAASAGIVSGYSNSGCFGPADSITREQIAVMLYRYAEKKKYDTSEKAGYDAFQDAGKVSGFAKDAMQWAVCAGIISGKDNGTRLDPQGNTSRAECVIMLQRFIEKYREE